MFPEKEKDIEDHYGELTGSYWNRSSFLYDAADAIEDLKQELAGREWADKGRRRVRPVTLWYPVWERAWFAVFPNGSVAELSDDRDNEELFELVSQSSEVVSAMIRRMRVSTFCGNLVLRNWRARTRDCARRMKG